MLNLSSLRLGGARGRRLAATALSPVIISLLVAACGLATEGELYDTGGVGGSMTTSGPTGSGGGSSTTEGAGGNGTGGQGGVSAGGGGTGGVGGAPLAEDCFDGIDNDKDKLTDCADVMDCEATVECVPTIPSGWTEYVRIVIQPHTGQPMPPACPGTAPLSYFSGPAGAPACEECSCMRTGASCSAPFIECFQGTLSCSGSVDRDEKAVDTNCISFQGFSSSGQDESCRIAGPATIVNAGTCTASGGAMTPAPLWQDDVSACPVVAAIGSGCDAGQACAPKPSAEYPGGLCIQANGEKQCPSGWTASEFVVYTGADDTRACSACMCNNDLGCNDDGNYAAHGDNSCGGGGVVVDGACTGAVAGNLGSNGSLKPKLATVKNSTCGGGQASGAVMPLGPVTICCR